WISTGKLYSAGNPQYGQTGEGTDHAYNTKDSSIAMVNEPQPTPKLIPALASKTVTRVACGTNHSIAVDDAGACYTWGNGGYGRLGHKVQKDEFAPKKVETFMGRLSVPPDAVIAAGTNATFCSGCELALPADPGLPLPACHACCSHCGRYSAVLVLLGQDEDVGRQPDVPSDLPRHARQALKHHRQQHPAGSVAPAPAASVAAEAGRQAGWNVRSVACGPAHFAIAADKSAITWGHATNGELGYGPKGKKSSANAAKCQALDDMHTHQLIGERLSDVQVLYKHHGIRQA
ncbi:hypothetical protein QJQ45_027175, partial [Haematococcus lacustris]